jgi:hypothetical protein
MGALAALATFALVGTGAAGAFAATAIPQPDATTEPTPVAATLADDPETKAATLEDPAGEGPGEDGTTATPEDPASSPTPTPEVNNPSDTKTPSTETVAETSEDATGEDTNRNTRTVPLPEDGGAVVTVKVGGYRTGIDQTAVSGLAGVTLYLYTTDTG